jgi:hypothetical protein
MRMKGTRLLLAVVFVAVCLTPDHAYANGGGWWDWLDAFSGPGPFNNGWQIDFRVACKVDHPGDTGVGEDASGDRAQWVGPLAVFGHGSRQGGGYKKSDGFKCLTNSREVRSTFEVRGGRITSETKALFSDTPRTELVGTVAANTIQAYFMRRLHPAFTVGAGAGVIWVSGDTVEGHPTRFVFTPLSVAFMPLTLFLSGNHSRQAGLVAIRFEEVGVIGRLKASDFNGRSSSSFETRGDLVRSVSITFDVTTLLH